MKIIVDAFGGDNAPLEIVRGAASAAQKFGVGIIFVGDEKTVRGIVSGEKLYDKGIEYVNADEVIAMDDEPVKAVRTKKNSSMVVGATLLAEGKGDAFVSAGSTGALLTAATLIVGRIKGIKRPALATVLPNAKGSSLLLDCGANAECKPEYLQQFAIMGSAYAKPMLGMEKPTVGLLNNGAEECKGTPLAKEAHALLKNTAGIDFVGNVESKEYVMGGCDVLVTDGFTGNILLKGIEGTAKFVMKEIKNTFMSSLKSKLAALMIKGNISGLKKKLDVSEHGGAPFLGIKAPVVKAHGSSDAKAFESAVRQAKCFAEADIIAAIEKSMPKTEVDS